MPDITRTKTARHTGRCRLCGEPIEPGDKIARKEREGGGWIGRWHHARCEIVCYGHIIPSSGGVPLYLGINALGERVVNRATGKIAS